MGVLERVYVCKNINQNVCVFVGMHVCMYACVYTNNATCLFRFFYFHYYHLNFSKKISLCLKQSLMQLRFLSD